MRLEPFTEADRALYETLVFNEETMRINLGRTFTPEEAERFFSAMLEANAGEPGFYKAYVNDAYVGMGALERDENGALEISYMLLPQFWNRGYGTALAETLLSLAAGRTETVAAITDPANVYSKRILEKAGFSLVKRFVNADGDPVERFEKRLS
ncbi:MAG: GNAT family N-acetyltransferase [Clostridia bacterium]|nr:GNAT family N-acetyltransferase [Clostridia bacterium]